MSAGWITPLLLTLALGLPASAAPSPRVLPSVAFSTPTSERNLSYLLGNDSYVMAVMMNDEQFKEAQSIIGRYKEEMALLLESIEKAETAYKNACKDLHASPETLKPLFDDFANAETAMEVLDFKLLPSLWGLFSEEEKPQVAKMQARINTLRNLIVDVEDGDKSLYQCAGDVDPMVGFFGTVLTDEQFEQACTIIKENNKARIDIQKKMGICNFKWSKVQMDMDASSAQVEQVFMNFRTASWDFYTLTRQRDLNLMALLTEDQKEALVRNQKRTQDYLAAFSAWRSKQEEPATRNLMYLRGYNGAMILSQYTDDQWVTMKARVQKFKADHRQLWNAQEEARAAYGKAVMDPAVTTDQVKVLFDKVSQAECAVHLLDRGVEMDMKAPLSAEQKTYLKNLKPRMKSYRQLLALWDDASKGCCGGIAPHVGTAVFVYQDKQYDEAVAIIKKAHPTLSPLYSDFMGKTKVYEKLIVKTDSTPAQVEEAFRATRAARFVHTLPARARTLALENMLSPEQKQMIQKLESRFWEYKGIIESE